MFVFIFRIVVGEKIGLRMVWYLWWCGGLILSGMNWNGLFGLCGKGVVLVVVK